MQLYLRRPSKQVYILRNGRYHFFERVHTGGLRVSEYNLGFELSKYSGRYLPGDYIWDDRSRCRYLVRALSWEFGLSFIGRTESLHLQCSVDGRNVGWHSADYFAAPHFYRICGERTYEV